MSIGRDGQPGHGECKRRVRHNGEQPMTISNEKLEAMAQVGLPDHPTPKEIFQIVGTLGRAFLVRDEDCRLVIQRIITARSEQESNHA